MERGNLSDIKNSINNNDYIKKIKNSNIVTRFNNEKQLFYSFVIKHWIKIIPSVFLLICLVIYFIYIYKRVPRYLKIFNKYNSIINVKPLEKCKNIIDNDFKLCDFYVASSYKSYLPCTNYYDYSSTLAIEKVLMYGARYIDLDIYNKDFNQCTTPVVCNGRELGNWHWTTTITFEKVCDTIRKTAFSDYIRNNTDPLFINLNLYINLNIQTADEIARILIKYFEYRLLPREYSYYGSNPNPNLFINIATTPIKKLFNKIIIICNNGFQHSKLEELVNISEKINGNYRKLTYSDIKESYDLNELTNYNKKNLTAVTTDKIYRKKNNFHYFTPWYTGSQFICMDYFCPDEYMKSYLNKFKNYSFVLKPLKLRYKPTKINPPKEQNPKVSFAPQKITTPIYSITY